MTARPDVQQLHIDATSCFDLTGIAACIGWPAGSVLMDEGGALVLPLGAGTPRPMAPIVVSRSQVPVVVIGSATLIPVASDRHPVRPVNAMPTGNAAPSSAVAHRRVRVTSRIKMPRSRACSRRRTRASRRARAPSAAKADADPAPNARQPCAADEAAGGFP